MAATPNDRNEIDQGTPFGIATHRFEERVASSLGQAGHVQPHFESNEAIRDGGLLFLLPALLAQGLLKTKDIYQIPATHYYGLESIVLTLAFMALARITNPEQLKQCKPGELGRIIGLDRVPEVKCLRKKIQLLSAQNKAAGLNNLLIKHWYHEDTATSQDAAFLYIDGHVRIYYGNKATLPATYISRQKLCLSATTEYWVNDAVGNPVMMVLGQLNEHLKKVIEESIIVQLQQAGLLDPSPVAADRPQCTLIFDREAYEPDFFHRLWIEHHIAVITYRKNVRDLWTEDVFNPTDTTVLGQNVTMQLCEQKVTLSGHSFREVRRLSEDGHQTAIITNHPELKTHEIAGRMFGRWSQENFFRYLIQDYDFDKMVQFGVETIDPQIQVVNPEYRKINHRIKKLREKIGRMKAKLFPLAEQAIDKEIDELPSITDKQMEYKEILDRCKEEEAQLIEKRAQIPARITLAEMPLQSRYNKLKTESKLLMNIIKMICYRAETAVAALTTPYLAKAQNEKRMFLKQLMSNCADIIPDYSNNTLNIALHSLSAPRYNEAASHLAKILNETETIFPGTNLKMVFSTTIDNTT